MRPDQALFDQVIDNPHDRWQAHIQFFGDSVREIGLSRRTISRIADRLIIRISDAVMV